MNKIEVIGVIPAAGKATRLVNIPFSKELYPIGYEEKGGDQIPKTVSSYLLDQMTDAGISSFHFVIRKGKWDIPNYFGGGKRFNANICYHVTDYSYGVPFSINQAYPVTKNKIVAIGFPDILIKPRGVYSKLLDKLHSNKKTDIVLGLFPSPEPLKWDMVDIRENKIHDIFIKSEKGKHLKYTWVIAVWRASFSRFLNDYLNNLLLSKKDSKLLSSECQLSNIFLSFMKKEFRIDYVFFDEGKCMDIGSPERLKKADLFLDDE